MSAWQRSDWHTPIRQQMLTKAGFASCDGRIGPFAYLCGHGRFDFTLLFEDYFLALAPSIIFILAALARISQLWGAKPKTIPSGIIYLKLAACAILCALNAVVLTKWVQTAQAAPAESVSIAAAALAVAAALALTVLTQQEQRRTIIPSTLITAYLLVTILFDGVRCRTLWLLGNTGHVAAYFSAALAAKVIILVLENQSKRSILIKDWQTYGREETSGLMNRGFLFWINDFLIKGHKSFLTPADMYALSGDLRSRPLLDRMRRDWRRHKGSGKNALLWNLITANKFSILLGAIPRTALALIKLAQPFLITRILTYMQLQGTDAAEPKDAGYAIIVAVALFSVLDPVIRSFYDQYEARIRVILRGALISTVLHHATGLEPGAKEGSATLTLITTDVARVTSSLSDIHELWIIPVEVCVGAWLLGRQVGVGAIGPAVTFVLAGLISAYLSKFMGLAQRQWSESVQRRLGDTTTVLGAMKETKMLGLVESWRLTISGHMDTQIEKSYLFRNLITLMNLAGNLPSSLAPVATFGIAILNRKASLDLTTAFTSLAIMGLVLAPLARLTSAVPLMFSSLAAAQRLQEFVEIAESSSTTTEVPYTDEAGTAATFSGNPVFAARGATIKVKSKDEPILSDVNFSIEPESFTVIAGKVGSGKSVLIRSLLGQTPTTGAMVKQTSNVAFCAQSTWLVNATARENIIGQSDWDEELYNSVVRACALDRDFEDLPDGDSALLGSKGLSLSGGQKLRVSLARAMYSRKEVVVVDDVLSGLDWATQRHIWKQVFSEEGILRKNGTTLVLTTHALHLIGTPDSVILLGDKGPGHVIQGTLEQLKANTNIVDLISSSEQEHKDDEGEGTTDSTGSSSRAISTAKKEDESKTDLLRKSGDLSLYSYYLAAVGWDRVAYLFFGGIMFAVLHVLPDIWLKNWTEANTNPDTAVNDTFYYWIYTLLAVTSLFAIVAIIWCFLVIVGPPGLRNIHQRVLRTVMRAPLSYFVATDTGDVINRFTRDIEQLDLELPLAFFQLILALFMGAASIAIILTGSKFMAVIIVPMILFVYVLQGFYLKTSRQLRFLDLNATAPLYNHFIETIDGASTIQAFGWETAFSSKGLKLLDEAQKPKFTLAIIQVWLEAVIGLFVASIFVLLITFSVTLPSSTSAGSVALAFTYLLNMGSILTMFVGSWTSLETSLGSIERLRSFEQNTPQEKEPENPQILETSWPSAGHVELKNLTAAYHKTDGPSFQVLENVNLSLQPGQKVAVCGRTGSGKSSLLLTLFRLLDLDAGSIVLDGVDIANIPQDVLRTHLIAVPQEPMIFPGTLRSNLSPVNAPKEVPPERLDEHLINCLRRVELWEMIHAQGGLDSAVDDLGLSLGQKQLICLARALARKDTSRILVLDEAMSAVDQKTEALMVKILETEFVNHTIISVVHRLNTVRDFDTIVLLDRGSVVETGAPNELLEKEGGKFRALWNGRSS